MSIAKASKIYTTLVPSLEEASKNLHPNRLANACPSSVDTSRFYSRSRCVPTNILGIRLF